LDQEITENVEREREMKLELEKVEKIIAELINLLKSPPKTSDTNRL